MSTDINVNDHFYSDESVKSVGDYLKLQSSVKNVFKNVEMLTGKTRAENKNKVECLQACWRIRYAAQRRSEETVES